jgi:hypothetical protein
MSEPQAVAVPAFERLTWKEICARFPDEWVMLADVEWFDEDHLAFDTALVIGHGRARREAFQSTDHLKERFTGWACLFTGAVRAPRQGFFRP